MTQQEKDLLLAKLLDSPQALTDQEIAAVLADDELRETYNTAAVLKSAAVPARVYDLDKEWQAFSRRVKPTRRTRIAFQPRRWSAAASLAVLLSIGAAAAGITYHIVTREPAVKEQQAETTAPKAKASTAKPQEQTPQDETKRLEEDLAFENITLAEIARQITAALSVKVIIDDASLSELRLYMTLPKGSTAADFTALIDAYDALAATLADGIITIKKEAKR